MKEKTYHCRSAKEFKLKDFLDTLILEPEEDKLLSDIRPYLEIMEKWGLEVKNTSYFLMSVRESLFINSDEDGETGSTEYFFWPMLGLQDSVDPYTKTFTYLEAQRFDPHTPTAESLFRKIAEKCMDEGFLRKDFTIDEYDERIECLYGLTKCGCFDDETLRYDFFEEFTPDLYETYTPKADSRVTAVMEYLKDKLPPLQYDTLKFHIEYGVQNWYLLADEVYDKDSKYENKLAKSNYSEFENHLLMKAAQNIMIYRDEIINIILF